MILSVYLGLVAAFAGPRTQAEMQTTCHPLLELALAHQRISMAGITAYEAVCVLSSHE